MLNRSFLTLQFEKYDNPGTAANYFGRSGFSLEATLQLIARQVQKLSADQNEFLEEITILFHHLFQGLGTANQIGELCGAQNNTQHGTFGNVHRLPSETSL